MHEAQRILIIEDDHRIGSSLCRALNAGGYLAAWHDTAATGEAAFDRAATDRERFDLVLLDLGLPDADGLDVCRRLVERDARVPVVILTARDDELDLVIGLDAGAADYVTKPFALAPLQARLRAHLRHRAAGNESATIAETKGLRIDRRSRLVELDAVEVPLRPKEFDLLARLETDSGAVVSRETLMADVWDEHWFGSTKTLDFHIGALRAKLDRPGEPSRITTVRGVGFRLER